jgi:hypothetical protein
MTESATFQRIVLGIRHNVPREGLRQAMGFASLLGIELRGLFFKDDELRSLAAFPFVREFRLLEGGWCHIQSSELAGAVEAAARVAERAFRESVKTLGLPSGFEIVRGRSVAEALASSSRSGDILVVAEPGSAGEREAPEFQATLEAALGSPASLMLVPAQTIRSSGPVVALVNAPDDPSLDVATKLAALTNEKVSVIDTARVAEMLRSEGMPESGGVAHGGHPIPPSRVADVFEPLRERLVVVTRGGFDRSIARSISSTRRVPVLVIEPRSDQGAKR